MAVSRYEIVRRLAADKRVLEIACGSGQGLGFIRRDAAAVVGGDVTYGLLARARAHYGRRIPLAQFDAHRLPFAPGSFDVVAMHEAIYYMADPITVFHECRRVLAPRGTLVITSINPAWRDFNPSPMATRYYTADQLKAALERVFPRVDMQFGFALAAPGPASVLVSLLKRAAVRTGMIPRTMGGKTLLKRVFLGPLVAVPPELSPGLAPVDEPRRVSLDAASGYQIIYAIAAL